jgi:flagellar biosynthesis/type III secretory pathway chaperone
LEKPVADILDSLGKLVELHQELVEACGLERDALVQADLKGMQDITLRKQKIVDSILVAEQVRSLNLVAYAHARGLAMEGLTLGRLIELLGSIDPKSAGALGAARLALTTVVNRAVELNDSNRALLERSLGYIEQMKRNVLGEAAPKSNTYNPQGQPKQSGGGSRLISREV